MEITELLKGKEFKVSNKKIHDYQLIGEEITKFTGEKAYFLFSRYPHPKILEAFRIAEKRNKRSLKYIIGIINNL